MRTNTSVKGKDYAFVAGTVKGKAGQNVDANYERVSSSSDHQQRWVAD